MYNDEDNDIKKVYKKRIKVFLVLLYYIIIIIISSSS